MKLQYPGDSKDGFKWDYHHFLMEALGYSRLKLFLDHFDHRIAIRSKIWNRRTVTTSGMVHTPTNFFPSANVSAIDLAFSQLLRPSN